MGHKGSVSFARRAAVPMTGPEVEQALEENEQSLVTELARKRTVTAVKTLEKCLTAKSASWAAKIAAAKTILEFGYGKPGQDQRAPAQEHGAGAVQVQIVLLRDGQEEPIDVTHRMLQGGASP